MVVQQNRKWRLNPPPPFLGISNKHLTHPVFSLCHAANKGGIPSAVIFFFLLLRSKVVSRISHRPCLVSWLFTAEETHSTCVCFLLISCCKQGGCSPQILRAATEMRCVTKDYSREIISKVFISLLQELVKQKDSVGECWTRHEQKKEKERGVTINDTVVTQFSVLSWTEWLSVSVRVHP